MASLISLPYGVLFEILSLSKPYDYERLMLTCKSLYDVGRPMLQRHNRLRKLYRRLSIQNFLRRGQDSNGIKFELYALEKVLPRLCMQILKDPLLPEYVQYLDFDAEEETDALRVALHRDAGGPIDADENDFATLIQHMKVAEVSHLGVEEWLNKIYHEADGQWCLLLMLVLLPNIDSISMCYGYEEEFREKNEERSLVLAQLVANANLSPSATASQPLCRLKEYSSMLGGYEQFARYAEDLLPLLALDSLEKLEVDNYLFEGRCRFSEHLFDRYMTFGTHLKYLRLEESAMGYEAASHMLKDMGQLEELMFTYSAHDEQGTSWNAGDFLDVLQRALGKSLRKLSLSMASDSWIWNLEPVSSNVKMFEVLEDFELDVALFDHIHDVRVHDGSHEDCRIEDFDASAPYVPRLEDFLPKSVQRFRLIYDDDIYHREYLRQFLGGNPRKVSEHSPDFKMTLVGPGFRAPLQEPREVIPAIQQLEEAGILNHSRTKVRDWRF